jgi:hypothetical protein
VLVTVNSAAFGPSICTAVILTGWVPRFVTTTVWSEDPPRGICCPKSSALGATSRTGRASSAGTAKAPSIMPIARTTAAAAPASMHLADRRLPLRSWGVPAVGEPAGARYRAEGKTAFEPRSRRPARSPSATAPEVVELVLGLRKELDEQGLDAGAHTVCWHLRQHHELMISAATVWRILSRHGQITAIAAEMRAVGVAVLVDEARYE